MPYLGQNRKGAADKAYIILAPLRNPILEKIHVIFNENTYLLEFINPVSVLILF